MVMRIRRRVEDGGLTPAAIGSRVPGDSGSGSRIKAASLEREAEASPPKMADRSEEAVRQMPRTVDALKT